MAAEDRQELLPCFCSKAEKVLTNMETMLKTKYTFSNAVIKFCEIFPWLVCKQYKIKSRRYYFVTNPYT